MLRRDGLAVSFYILCAISIYHSVALQTAIWRLKNNPKGLSSTIPYHIGLLVGEPYTMPLYDDPRVLLLTQETTHYNASYPESEKEWLAGFPTGIGTYRLKSHSNNRSVLTAMYHQLHCVQTLGKQLLHTDRPYWPHIQGCFNFLRQMALCRPDLTLEPGDVLKRNFTLQRTGAVHVCRNWEYVQSTLTNDWKAWDAIRRIKEHS